VETCAFHQVDFTLDFTGSSNYNITFSGPRAAALSPTAGSVTVGPYLREPVARLKIANRYTDALLSYKMSWRVGEPDAAAVAAERAKEGERMGGVIAAAAARQKGPMDVREAPQACEKVRRVMLPPPAVSPVPPLPSRMHECADAAFPYPALPSPARRAFSFHPPSSTTDPLVIRPRLTTLPPCPTFPLPPSRSGDLF
jgi:hypothetical protein